MRGLHKGPNNLATPLARQKQSLRLLHSLGACCGLSGRCGLTFGLGFDAVLACRACVVSIGPNVRIGLRPTAVLFMHVTLVYRN